MKGAKWAAMFVRSAIGGVMLLFAAIPYDVYSSNVKSQQDCGNNLKRASAARVVESSGAW